MLTGKQRRYLRGLGHHLQPVVQAGKEGLTERLVSALDAALCDHELIKVKLGEAFSGDRHEAAKSLAGSTSSDLVQVLGRTLLFYKRREKDPEIKLPAGGPDTASSSSDDDETGA